MIVLLSCQHFRNHFNATFDNRTVFNIITVIIGAVFLLISSPIYSQENTAPTPSLKGHWVTPNYDFESGKPEDRGATATAMAYSKTNAAVGVAIYVSPAMPKEKAEKYGEGLMRMFAKKKIPANYYIQRLGKNNGKEKGAMDFFVHGYFIGTYAGKDLPAGILLAIDLFNGEPYAVEMLKEGSL